MALSLVKGAVIQNADGNVQVNCLLSGMFEIRAVDDIHVQVPSFIGNGQTFALRIIQWSEENIAVTWDSAFGPAAELTSGNMGEGHSWVGYFLYDEGKIYCLGWATSDVPESIE